jgi:hypothetical protein
MKISTILDKIDERQLFVPAFQREYVWKREDAKELIDSLVKSYPTGTMLTWETNKPPELKGQHIYDEKQGAVRILLDGQQRITTLYMLIRGTIPHYYTAQEITNDTRGLYVNADTLELEYYSKQKMENDPTWCNITEIFKRNSRARDITELLEKKGQAVSKERSNSIDDNIRAIENILERDFPEQTVPVRATIREAITIFYKVNASGVSLTDAELALAQISGYWPKARDIFKKKLAQLAQQGFVFKLDFIVYVLLGCLYHVGSDMTKLHGVDNNEKLREAWKKLETHTLDYVCGILRSRAFVDHTKEINSIYALIPIIVYCFEKDKSHLNEEEIGKIIKWFYYSQIRTRYVSQLPQKLDRDLRTVAGADLKDAQVSGKNPFDVLLEVIAEERRLEITADEFEGSTINHPLFGLMVWYFKSRGAICFTTGLAIRQAMGNRYQLENDHIFSFSRLKKAGYGKESRTKYSLAQELTNRAILTRTANRAKSDKEADVYLASVKEKFPSALSLQSVPLDQALWRTDSYVDFLKSRRKMLAGEMNAFLQDIVVSGDGAAEVSLEDLVSEGESDELEFKSSLRWDYDNQAISKKLEDVILKSVASFANGQGGTLLIGVGDDGAPLGLEKDYISLSGDRDRFELHMRNLFNQAFGHSFVASKLRVSFPTVLGTQICQVEINPATQPVILNLLDKSGQKIEKFYVRSGNSSQDMPLSEMHSYFEDRFA